jgi:hypothetical protein
MPTSGAAAWDHPEEILMGPPTTILDEGGTLEGVGGDPCREMT